VWVHPRRRGQNLAAGATAAVVVRLQRIGRVASLYVNAYNLPARATYRRVGFTQVGSFATVLF
jgi:predicted GNAT family acetyltransferase